MCPPAGPARAAARLPGQGLRELPPADARPAGDHAARLDGAQPGRPRRWRWSSCWPTSPTGSATSRTRSPPRPTWAPPAGGCRCAATPGCSTTGCTRAATPGCSCSSPSTPASSWQPRRWHGPGPTSRRWCSRRCTRSGCAPPTTRSSFYTWSDEQCCLPAGATRATLRTRWTDELELVVGDFLLLEETVDPVTGGEADLAHRQVVRLTEVAATSRPARRQDGGRGGLGSGATPCRFPLCVSVEGRGHRPWPGATSPWPTTAPGAPASRCRPSAPAPPGRWRPLAPEVPLAFAIPVRSGVAGGRPAADRAAPGPGRDRAARRRPETGGRCPTCSAAGPTTPVFVVEIEDDGETRLRFGDDASGQAAAARTPVPGRLPGRLRAGRQRRRRGDRPAGRRGRRRHRRSATRWPRPAAPTRSRPSGFGRSPRRPSGARSGR